MVQLVSEGYIPTLGLRLLRGRVLSEADVNDARKVAVVNQTLVNLFSQAKIRWASGSSSTGH